MKENKYMEGFRHREVMRGEKVAGLCVYPYPHDALRDIKGSYRGYVVLPEQTHSLNVGIAKNLSDCFPQTDAVVTFERNLPVGVVTADCVPILIYAPDVEGVAAVHAGWKGTLGGIVERTIDTLTTHGASPENMIVAFGPSISMLKYEVDEELADKFREAGFADHVAYPSAKAAGSPIDAQGRTGQCPSDNQLQGAVQGRTDEDKPCNRTHASREEIYGKAPMQDKPHIDLQGINVERMLRKGVRKENITTSSDCSYAALDADGMPLYQSHRRSHGGPGRNLTLIYLT